MNDGYDPLLQVAQLEDSFYRTSWTLHTNHWLSVIRRTDFEQITIQKKIRSSNEMLRAENSYKIQTMICQPLSIFRHAAGDTIASVDFCPQLRVFSGTSTL